MNIFDMIRPVLKQKGFTNEQIEELEKESAKPRKNEEMPEWQQKLQIITNTNQKWQDKVKILVDYAKNNEVDKIILEAIPKEPFEIYGYYFYLVCILRELYPYRSTFEVISLMYQALHTLIDNIDVIKESYIITETEQIKARDYNNKIKNAREKAEEYANKINWDNFKTNYSTIDYLYNKALKTKR